MGREYDSASLLNNLRYLALFEKKAYSLYEDISERLEVPLAKAFMTGISLDSRKHAISLKAITANMPKDRPKNIDLPKEMKEAWDSIDAFQIELSKVDTMNSEEMAYLCTQLNSLETSLASEYGDLLEFKALEAMYRELNRSRKITFETLKTILLEAQHDEEYHKLILVMVTEHLLRQEESRIDNTPTVSFRNPDAWNRPAPMTQ